MKRLALMLAASSLLMLAAKAPAQPLSQLTCVMAGCQWKNNECVCPTATPTPATTATPTPAPAATPWPPAGTIKLPVTSLDKVVVRELGKRAWESLSVYIQAPAERTLFLNLYGILVTSTGETWTATAPTHKNPFQTMYGTPYPWSMRRMATWESFRPYHSLMVGPASWIHMTGFAFLAGPELDALAGSIIYYAYGTTTMMNVAAVRWEKK